MLKRPIMCFIVIAVAAGLMTSCILDPKKAKEDTPTVIKEYEDLKEKDDVLWNLELAYNDRNIKQFERLLDDEFVFFFSEADYNEGGVPISWERPIEINTNTNLFNENLDGPLRATNIDLRLTYTKGEWTEILQGNDESWFSKEVEYNITVQTVSGVDYKGNRLKAQFIIREAIPDGETEKIWRIIRWRDIGEDR
jgi:hypothetical protein